MANQIWPAYARIHADETFARRPDVARTEYDDGAVQQRRIYTQGTYVRQITAELGTRATDFDAWAEAHAHRYFLARGPQDAVWRQARVIGGASGIQYRQVGTSASGPLWTLECSLEGPAAAYPGISIWSPDLALGDSSHVFVRLLHGQWWTRVNPPPTIFDAEAQLPVASRYTTDPPAGVLPAAWMTQGAVAYLAQAGIQRGRATSATVHFVLSDTPGVSSRTAHQIGPNMRWSARRHVVTVWRAGSRTLTVGWANAPANDPEPYTVVPSNVDDVRSFIAHILPPSGAARGDFALLWAGPDSVIDLETLTTLDIGAAPVIA